MKKILFLFALSLLPVLACAQSTCETRVDAHQRATTMQRVAYCLSGDTTTDNTYGGLLYSEVSSHDPVPAQAQPAQKVTAKPGDFPQDRVSVSQYYVGTPQFPQLYADQTEFQPVPTTNVTYTDQVVYTEEPVYANTPVEGNAPMYTQETVYTTPQPVYVPNSTQPQYIPYTQVDDTQFVYVPSPTVPVRAGYGNAASQNNSNAQQTQRSVVEETYAQSESAVIPTKAGIKARQTKPKRTPVALAAESIEPAPAQSNTSDSSADTYNYQGDTTQTYPTAEDPLGVSAQSGEQPLPVNNPYDMPSDDLSYETVPAN